MEECLDLPQDRPELGLLLAEDHEVVHVSEIGAAAEMLLHEVVQWVEIEVGEELAREVADRQAAPPLDRREEIVAGEPEERVGMSTAAVEDSVQKVEEPAILDPSLDDGFLHIVVDHSKAARA